MALDRLMRRTFILGILNGAFFNLGSVFIDPSTVLALFIAALTGSDAAVGLMAAASSIGTIVPQILVAGRVGGVAKKMRYYHYSVAIRAAALLGLVCSVAFLSAAGLVSALVILTYGIYSFGGGFAFIPFMEVVGDTLRPSQRSSFFALRSFFGGLMAMLGGYVVKIVLSSPDRFVFPKGYLILFVLGAFFGLLAMISFSLVKEPAVERSLNSVRLGETIRSARRVLSEDEVYRRFLVIRSLIALAGISGPFYVLHAVRVLELEAGKVGFLIVSMTAGGVISNLVWGRIGDRQGSRRVIIGASILLFSAPLSALLTGIVHDLSSAVVTFLLLGLANAGAYIGLTNYLLDHCEPERRPIYVGMTNVVVGFLSAGPFIGGLVSGYFGYQILFLVSLVCTGAAAVLALRLSEPRGAAEKRFPTHVKYF